MNFGSVEINFPEELRGKQLVLGIDEAGRGPVLGPMVYSCAFAEKDFKWPKEVDDSKKLTPQKREEILENLKEMPIGFSVRVFTAVEISSKMLSNQINLNGIGHYGARILIQSVIDAGLNIHHVYVDTIGPPDKYQAELKEFFPKLKITVAAKADATYKCVGAASINAKVIRDNILHNFEFEEKGVEFTSDFGSGYTSDKKTTNWLVDNFDPVFGFPSFVRFSWDTAQKVITKQNAEVDFKTESKKPIDSPYFSARLLQSVLL